MKKMKQNNSVSTLFNLPDFEYKFDSDESFSLNFINILVEELNKTVWETIKDDHEI